MKKQIFYLVFFTTSLLMSQDMVLSGNNLSEAEFHTAINPIDPNHIVLAAMYDPKAPYNFSHSLKIYYTKDSGNTWALSNFNGNYDSNETGAGDPVLAFDRNGDVFLVNITLSSAPERVRNTIISKSNDGGKTWALTSNVGDTYTDKPWFAIDTYNNSPYVDNMYIPQVRGEVFLFSLDNNSQTTSTLTIPNGDQLPSVTVKKDGTVFTSTVDILTGHPVELSLYVQEYSNGGASLVHSTKVTSFPNFNFNAPDISKRFQPTPYLAIDNSGGAYDGRLYLSYTASETNNPDYFNIYLTYSDDNGITWSTPKIVHNDQQEKVQQFYSSIYVNKKGVVILDWYDRRNHSNTNKLTDFFLGVSHDGGDTFVETQLNSEPSDFDFVIPSNNNFGIGEYHQLVATDDEAIAFWSDGRTNDNKLSIYMAKVDLSGPLSVNEYSTISNTISISSFYPQPSNKKVYSNIKLDKSTDIKYIIFNSIGQKVLENDWEKYDTGKHKLAIDIDLPSGTYFIKIITKDGYFKTQKLVNN